ncbi:MAG: hypothetical protein K0R21_66 [Anaerocolumna sp.]|jgi:hypothetical protein|nr:hypothetical protein [Anaerocolumna sp.]
MQNYNDMFKYYTTAGSGRINRMEGGSNSPSAQSERDENGSGSLIIDDNTIYEIDDECVEKVRKSRTSQRYDRNNSKG